MAGEGKDKVQASNFQIGTSLQPRHGPRTCIRRPIQGVALEVLAEIRPRCFRGYSFTNVLAGAQNDSGAEPQCQSHPRYSCVARVTLETIIEIHLGDLSY